MDNESRLRRKQELIDLYTIQNLTIFEIAEYLGINWRTVYKRLVTFGIPIQPNRKDKYLNKNRFKLPEPSERLAEFFGILMGDGHICRSQFFITLNEEQEKDYINYVALQIQELFGVLPKRSKRRGKVIDLFLTSVEMMAHLKSLSLYSNHKIKKPPVVPSWIFLKSSYRQACLRGIFDTDGSIYRLRNGLQVSFTNNAPTVLVQIRNLLLAEGFNPSQTTRFRVYLTRKSDLKRFFEVVRPRNSKHQRRYSEFCKKPG